MTTAPPRFIGLDIHKEYFVAVGVNARREVVFGPRRISNYQLETWISQQLSAEDVLVLEMTTNAYQFYDSLLPHVHSVLVVHPPQVALVTKVPVKTDQKAALALAQLHAAGLLTGVWIPPQAVRNLRALLAQREKMIRLSAQAKNRLTSLLHRKHLLLPEKPFVPAGRAWWESLPLSDTERFLLRSDLDPLQFAQQQIEHLEACLKQASAQDDRTAQLVQLPGVGWLTAITLLAAIGDIARFPSAKHLVGYAGLGARRHDSGMTHTSGRITKAGRRDLRRALVNAANRAVQHHPHWQHELERLQPHSGRSKAVVAIARKLLVAVWYVLTQQTADRFAEPASVARAFFDHAYSIGRQNLPADQTVLDYVRARSARVVLGWPVTETPPSRLRQKTQ
jgi:transposase